MYKKYFAVLLSVGFAGCNGVEPVTPGVIEDFPFERPEPKASSSPTPTPTTSTTPTASPSPTVTPTPRPTPTSTPSPSPTASAKPLALVYGGPGVLTGTDDTLERARAVALAAGFRVLTVTQVVDEAVLSGASVWIQPGGPNLSADAYMNANGMARQVREFVERGGGYVGFCGGAFSAVNNLELIPGSAWNLNQATGKIPVRWLGTTRYLHFEYGPYIILSGSTTEVVATYSNGSVAAARAHYGKGKVFISGPHPEASAYWPPTYDPDGIDNDLAIQMIQYVARRPDPVE
jgi:glutamine amidotransferase-like uncharacterized protein